MSLLSCRTLEVLWGTPPPLNHHTEKEGTASIGEKSASGGVKSPPTFLFEFVLCPSLQYHPTVPI